LLPGQPAPPPEQAPPPARTPKGLILGRAALVTCLLSTAVLLFLPAPYILEMPGPTVDTLGSLDEIDLVQVPDPPSHEITGELRLSTVTTAGSNRDLPLMRAIVGYLNPRAALVPYEAAYPITSSREEREQDSSLQMTSSQDAAIAAAVVHLDVATGVKIEERTSEAAIEALRDDDELLTVGGAPVYSFTSLRSALAQHSGGTPIDLTIRRDGAEQQVTLLTQAADDGGALLGVIVAFVTVPDIRFGIDRIGGSSAGLMFALAIIDKMGDVDLAAGRTIAGTGTITLSGEVGPIGGIRQKLIGAQRDGAEVFLAPEANCREVAGHAPDGMQVVRVGTLTQALAALDALRDGRGADLPTC